VTHLAVLGSLSQVVDEVRAHETVYLRYSEGPEEDLIRRSSRDYEADVELPGLSVTVASPEPWWPGPAEDWVARRLCRVGGGPRAVCLVAHRSDRRQRSGP
jgi:hypothetical protein